MLTVEQGSKYQILISYRMWNFRIGCGAIILDSVIYDDISGDMSQ